MISRQVPRGEALEIRARGGGRFNVAERLLFLGSLLFGEAGQMVAAAAAAAASSFTVNRTIAREEGSRARFSFYLRVSVYSLSAEDVRARQNMRI